MKPLKISLVYDKCNVLSNELASIISEGLDHTVRFDWDNLADNFPCDPYFTSVQYSNSPLSLNITGSNTFANFNPQMGLCKSGADSP